MSAANRPLSFSSSRQAAKRLASRSSLAAWALSVSTHSGIKRQREVETVGERMVARRHRPNHIPDCRSVDNPSVLFGSLAVAALLWRDQNPRLFPLASAPRVPLNPGAATGKPATTDSHAEQRAHFVRPLSARFACSPIAAMIGSSFTYPATSDPRCGIPPPFIHGATTWPTT